MEWKSKISKEYSRKILTTKMNQSEDRISELKDKAEDLNKISKEYEERT